MKQYDVAELQRINKVIYGIIGRIDNPIQAARNLAARLDKLAEESDFATKVRNEIFKYQPGRSKKAVSLRKEAASLRAWAEEQEKPKTKPVVIHTPQCFRLKPGDIVMVDGYKHEVTGVGQNTFSVRKTSIPAPGE